MGIYSQVHFIFTFGKTVVPSGTALDGGQLLPKMVPQVPITELNLNQVQQLQLPPPQETRL